jgi:2-polyprenyl-3-methyl-5-hydroxy-6-metoxy-1,4-benzoquinol methylase
MSGASQKESEPATYALGHAEQELRRLATQARLIDPFTRHFLIMAGIGHGMRVLDVGSGAGDVAMLAANLVGSAGEIVGCDPAAAAVDTARARVLAKSLSNVSFREGDPANMEFEKPFDAIMGRYVLQFMPDPVVALRKLVRHLRPGGIVVFHELDWDGARSAPPVPTYDRCCRWVAQTLEQSGAETHMAVKLHSVFVAAELPPPTMQLRAVIGAGSGRLEAVRLVTDLFETLLPAMQRLGIVTAIEVDLPTLVNRIMKESQSGNAIVGRAEVGAWTRL